MHSNERDGGSFHGYTGPVSPYSDLWHRLNSSSPAMRLLSSLYLISFAQLPRCNNDNCTFTPSITVTFSFSSIPNDTFRFVLPLPPISTVLYSHHLVHGIKIPLSYRDERTLMTAATTATGAQNTSIKVILALQYPPRSFVGWNNSEPIIDSRVHATALERVDGSYSSNEFQRMYTTSESFYSLWSEQLLLETRTLLFCHT